MTDKDKLIEEQAAEIARLHAEADDRDIAIARLTADVRHLHGVIDRIGGYTGGSGGGARTPQYAADAQGGSGGPGGGGRVLDPGWRQGLPSTTDAARPPGSQPGLPSTTGPAGVPGGCGGRAGRNTTSDDL